MDLKKFELEVPVEVSDESIKQAVLKVLPNSKIARTSTPEQVEEDALEYGLLLEG